MKKNLKLSFSLRSCLSCLFTVYALMECCDFKAWPNARNILKQHLATLLHGVETDIERAVYER